MLCYPEAYAHIYQKMQSFNIKIYAPNDILYTGYLSLEPSTRSTYDIAMRDATIDGLITMDNNIDQLKPGRIFYREVNSSEKFILQSVNQFEMQKNTRNINAIKQNSIVTIKRKEYNSETGEEEFQSVYEDIVSFVTMENYDEKNFQAGTEDTTKINIQIPKRDVNDTLYVLKNGDRIILSNLEKDMSREVKIESVDEFGVPGVIRIYGTYETRSGD